MDVDFFDFFDLPFDFILDLFEWGPPGVREKVPPTRAEIEALLDREARKLRVADLAQLERDRRGGALRLADFRRRYARLAHVQPDEDPAASGTYGPNGAAVTAVLARIDGMDPADWEVASDHLTNLQANPSMREALLPGYRAAVGEAIGCARLSAAAAIEAALRDHIPAERRSAVEPALRWLAVTLVVGDRLTPNPSGLPQAALAAMVRGRGRQSRAPRQPDISSRSSRSS